MRLYAVEIPLNPYQGLKRNEVTPRPHRRHVEIPLNPYQGLKREFKESSTLPGVSKFLLIPIRD